MEKRSKNSVKRTGWLEGHKMPSVKAVLKKAEEAAASVFEDQEYLTTYGSTGNGDPWGEEGRRQLFRTATH